VIKTALNRHPGVQRRPDSNTYQFGLRTPRDLLSQFPGPWVIRCSLGTADLREANDKAKALQAEWALRFEAMRSGKPVPADVSALRADLLSRVEAALLGIDERTAGLDAATRSERVEMVEWQLAEARDALSSGTVVDWGHEWLGRVVKHRSPVADAEAMAALVLMLELHLEALHDLTRTFPLRVEKLKARRALVASAFPTPAANDLASRDAGQRGGRRISDALSAWSEKDRPAKTVGALTRHASQFAALMGDPVLSSIDKVEAIRFRDALRAWAKAKGKTARTADNALVSIRALVNTARDRGWVEGNPFERLTVESGGKESVGREPWTHDELRTLFNDPIWLGYHLPTARKAGADAAYWIPLIACYTGARVSEIAQLWTDDLTLSAGQEVIEFRPNAERGQSLKSKGSWRAVPMHSELIRLGLPVYAASLPEGPLFPALPVAGQNGAGGQF
jgi:integrase